MKKLMTLAIGLGLVLGTVSFAAPKDDEKKTTTEKPKKAKKTKKTDEKKTDKM
jgi:hypothetical protein